MHPCHVWNKGRSTHAKFVPEPENFPRRRRTDTDIPNAVARVLQHQLPERDCGHCASCAGSAAQEEIVWIRILRDRARAGQVQMQVDLQPSASCDILPAPVCLDRTDNSMFLATHALNITTVDKEYARPLLCTSPSCSLSCGSPSMPHQGSSASAYGMLAGKPDELFLRGQVDSALAAFLLSSVIIMVIMVICRLLEDTRDSVQAGKERRAGIPSGRLQRVLHNVFYRDAVGVSDVHLGDCRANACGKLVEGAYHGIRVLASM